MNLNRKQMLLLMVMSLIALAFGFILELSGKPKIEMFWAIGALFMGLASFFHTLWMIDELKKEMQKQ